MNADITSTSTPNTTPAQPALPPSEIVDSGRIRVGAGFRLLPTKG